MALVKRFSEKLSVVKTAVQAAVPACGRRLGRAEKCRAGIKGAPMVAGAAVAIAGRLIETMQRWLRKTCFRNRQRLRHVVLRSYLLLLNPV